MSKILLIGGTSDAVLCAKELLAEGHEVLHSAFSPQPLPFPQHPSLHLRQGPLDCAGFMDLMSQESIQRVVDASHPYAIRLHEEIRQATSRTHIPYERRERPQHTYPETWVHQVESHEAAAKLACQLGSCILLTTGSRHIHIYAQTAITAGQNLYARILDDAAGIAACLAAGVPRDHLILGRGPFSYEENCTQIRRCSANVLITKDSGEAGGVPAKIAAAGAENCQVVLITRPLLQPFKE